MKQTVFEIFSLSFIVLSLLPFPAWSQGVAISCPPNLKNLRLIEGQESVFFITVINYMPEPIIVRLSDNCDNRNVSISYPATVKIPAGSSEEGSVHRIEVKLTAKSAGDFAFEVDLVCLPVTEENLPGARVLGSFGVPFAGQVMSSPAEVSEVPSKNYAKTLAVVLLVLSAAIVAIFLRKFRQRLFLKAKLI